MKIKTLVTMVILVFLSNIIVAEGVKTTSERNVEFITTYESELNLEDWMLSDSIWECDSMRYKNHKISVDMRQGLRQGLRQGDMTQVGIGQSYIRSGMKQGLRQGDTRQGLRDYQNVRQNRCVSKRGDMRQNRYVSKRGDMRQNRHVSKRGIITPEMIHDRANKMEEMSKMMHKKADMMQKTD